MVDAYSDAVEAMKEDPEFQQKSSEVLGGYPLYSGAEFEDEVRESFEVEDEVREYVLDLLETEYDTTIEGS